MIKSINVKELPFHKVLLSCFKAFTLNDKDLCILFFLSLVTVFYFIEAKIWIKPKLFIPSQRLARRLGC